MKFPLAHGHYFGINPLDVKVHDGSENRADEQCLKKFQRKYVETWDRSGTVTGRFDGPTQRACIAVQRDHGLPITAVLDADTWKAAFDGPKATESQDHDVPVVESTPRQEEAPRASAAALEASGTPTAPDPGSVRDQQPEETVPEWFDPHNPLGPRSVGPAVRKVRSLLGLQNRDTWSDQVTARIRGIQKVNRLPNTGMVDSATARILDKLPGKP